MKRSWVGLGLVLLGLGASCTSAGAETEKVIIKGTSKGSKVSGIAQLADTPSGLKVSVKVAGVQPGKHGIHIHENGDCGDAGKAAGGHFNPANTPHGFLPTDGPAKAHAGDMGNIEVGRKGKGKATVVLPGVSLTGANGTQSVKGRAIILHEKVDDFGQPTGNAGARIGCGPIVITGK